MVLLELFDNESEVYVCVFFEKLMEEVFEVGFVVDVVVVENFVQLCVFWDLCEYILFVQVDEGFNIKYDIVVLILLIVCFIDEIDVVIQ